MSLRLSPDSQMGSFHAGYDCFEISISNMMHFFKNRQYITLRKGLSWRTCQGLSQCLQLLVACDAGPQERIFITIVVREKKQLYRCRCYNTNRDDNLSQCLGHNLLISADGCSKNLSYQLQNLGIVSQLTFNVLANPQLSANPIHTLWSISRLTYVVGLAVSNRIY